MTDILRIKPSGYIHAWYSGYVQEFADGTKVRQAKCGRVVSQRDLTAYFPPKGRHCRFCFPPEETG